MSENEGVQLSMRGVAILLVLVVGVVVYVSVGIAYASSVGYLTPGGNWLETLINTGIRIAAWPLMLATHH